MAEYQPLLLLATLGLLGMGLLGARDLRRKGAKPVAMALVLALPIVIGALFEGTALLGWPLVLPIAAAAVFAGTPLCPECLIRLSGGPRPLVALGEAVIQISRLCLDFEYAPDAATKQVLAGRVLERLRRLDRIRRPATTEYIDLFQEEIGHFVEGTPWPSHEAKYRRLHELELEFQPRFDELGVTGEIRKWRPPAGHHPNR